MWNKCLLAFLLIPFISGCSSLPALMTKTVIETPTIIHPAPPLPPNLIDFNVLVVNEKLLDEMAKVADGKTAYIVVDSENYELILKNFNELRRYIENQKSIILYYKKVLTKETPKEEVK